MECDHDHDMTRPIEAPTLEQPPEPWESPYVTWDQSGNLWSARIRQAEKGEPQHRLMATGLNCCKKHAVVDNDCLIKQEQAWIQVMRRFQENVQLLTTDPTTPHTWKQHRASSGKDVAMDFKNVITTACSYPAYAECFTTYFGTSPTTFINANFDDQYFDQELVFAIILSVHTASTWMNKIKTAKAGATKHKTLAHGIDFGPNSLDHTFLAEMRRNLFALLILHNRENRVAPDALILIGGEMNREQPHSLGYDLSNCKLIICSNKGDDIMDNASERRFKDYFPRHPGMTAHYVEDIYKVTEEQFPALFDGTYKNVVVHTSNAIYYVSKWLGRYARPGWKIFAISHRYNEHSTNGTYQYQMRGFIDASETTIKL